MRGDEGAGCPGKDNAVSALPRMCLNALKASSENDAAAGKEFRPLLRTATHTIVRPRPRSPSPKTAPRPPLNRPAAWNESAASSGVGCNEAISGLTYRPLKDYVKTEGVSRCATMLDELLMDRIEAEIIAARGSARIPTGPPRRCGAGSVAPCVRVVLPHQDHRFAVRMPEQGRAVHDRRSEMPRPKSAPLNFALVRPRLLLALRCVSNQPPAP